MGGCLAPQTILDWLITVQKTAACVKPVHRKSIYKFIMLVLSAIICAANTSSYLKDSAANVSPKALLYRSGATLAPTYKTCI